MFRYAARTSAGLTDARDSWGDGVWPETDRNSTDDATAIWWDPDATGKDEAGNEGTGQIVYVDGGHRYLPGEWPTDPIPWFDDEGAVAIYDGASGRAARVPGLARVSRGRIAHLGPPPASLSAAGGG